MDEDSDSDDSIAGTDPKTRLFGKRKTPEGKSPKDQSHNEIEERKLQSKEEKCRI